ncbi:unnamed protein product [Prunus armeniaca]
MGGFGGANPKWVPATKICQGKEWGPATWAGPKGRLARVPARGQSDVSALQCPLQCSNNSSLPRGSFWALQSPFFQQSNGSQFFAQ